MIYKYVFYICNMLNKSKQFVRYLDNYDKKNQKKYNASLITSISKEYNDIWSTQFKVSAISNKFECYNYYDTNCIATRVLVEEKIPSTETIKKVMIEDNIDTISDILSVIDKYDYNDHCEYNIDFRAIISIKEELIELNNMIGMKELKQNVLEQLLYFLQNLHLSDTGGDYKHTVLYGPPGTGKTQIAKIIGKMYSKIGVLQKNIFIKATRQDLIAGYLGQTAIKTAKIIEEAKGGVLFIDEAYSLGSNDGQDSFSKECLDTLCESLSNYKDDLMVIIAGYEKDLDDTFFKVNKGLQSRFIWRFTMTPYTSTELCDIFISIIKNSEWVVDFDREKMVIWFAENDKEFINYGRDMEQLFTYLKISHSKRIYGLSKDLRKHITMVDVKNGYEMFISHRKKKEITRRYDFYT
jgi:SpoVK/Ycf46/Vps4 family AAA+-type ATPase